MSQKRKIKQRKKRQQRQRKLLLIRRILTIILIILCIFAAAIAIKKYVIPFFEKSNEETDVNKESENHTIIRDLFLEEEEPFEPISITVSSMGDCTIGRDVHNVYSRSLNGYYDAHGADYFFKNVRDILEADDLSIINFEGTFTESESRMDKTYAFKAPPEYVKILTGSSIEAANIANNHSKDYGEQSQKDTIATLEDAGIVNFGYERVQIMEINGIKVGLTGIYELAEGLGKQTEVKSNIAKLKEQGAQLIIVNFHWGIEREYIPNNTQKTLARLAIDEGADLVIGHHPHVLQGIEKYKGKYIAYSLGNFCFGGNMNPGDKDTMIFQQTFTFGEEGLILDDEINIIPCRLSSVTDKNDYCPTPLEGSEKERIMDKLEKYSEGLTVQPEPDGE